MPSIETLVALVVFQVSTTGFPAVTVCGFAVILAVGAGIIAGGGPPTGAGATFLWQPAIVSMATRPAVNRNDLRYACFMVLSLSYNLFLRPHRPQVWYQSSNTIPSSLFTSSSSPASCCRRCVSVAAGLFHRPASSRCLCGRLPFAGKRYAFHPETTMESH